MKNRIRLTESQLQQIIKKSVKSILGENITRNQRGHLVWNPKDNSEYSIGSEGENGWPKILKNGNETGYQLSGWREIPDENGNYMSREYDLWNSLKGNDTDFIEESKYNDVFDYADNSSDSADKKDKALKKHSKRCNQRATNKDWLSHKEKWLPTWEKRYGKESNKESMKKHREGWKF